MTSSLVGSEMCIRDSFSSAPSRVCVVASSRLAVSILLRCRPRKPLHVACLLYTSDAADDM
eukprot:8703383-Prorocentrum_lima.AAC.1